MQYISVPIRKIATQIAPRIWQGGVKSLRDCGPLMIKGVAMTALLECDAGVEIVSPYTCELPLRDEKADLMYARDLHYLARTMADLVESGQSVASLCYEGRNRSGLLTGIILHELGMDGADAVKLIRKRRKRQALSTYEFADYLESLVA